MCLSIANKTFKACVRRNHILLHFYLEVSNIGPEILLPYTSVQKTPLCVMRYCRCTATNSWIQISCSLLCPLVEHLEYLQHSLQNNNNSAFISVLFCLTSNVSLGHCIMYEATIFKQNCTLWLALAYSSCHDQNQISKWRLRFSKCDFDFLQRLPRIANATAYVHIATTQNKTAYLNLFILFYFFLYNDDLKKTPNALYSPKVLV